jgi:hypothetical protein
MGARSRLLAPPVWELEPELLLAEHSASNAMLKITLDFIETS